MSAARCAACPVPADEACRRDLHPWFCAFAAASPEKRAHVAGRNAFAAPRPMPASFPPLATQARNLAGAVVDFVASGGALTTPEERGRRLAICRDCEHFDPGPPGRCRICGCVANLAARVASKYCPDVPPRW